MKNFLFLLLFVTLCSSALFAQQTTYPTANNLFIISYAGYTDGHYILSIKNNLNCTEHIPVSWNGQDTVIQVPGKTDLPIMLPGVYKSGGQIRIKTPEKCGGKNYEITVFFMPALISLPVREPTLAGPSPKPAKTFKAVAVNINTYESVETTGTTAFDVASRLKPGLYKIFINGAEVKMMRL